MRLNIETNLGVLADVLEKYRRIKTTLTENDGAEKIVLLDKHDYEREEKITLTSIRHSRQHDKYIDGRLDEFILLGKMGGGKILSVDLSAFVPGEWKITDDILLRLGIPVLDNFCAYSQVYEEQEGENILGFSHYMLEKIARQSFTDPPAENLPEKE
jgi:hypothetical protein